jgi:hypothetical protein
MPPSEATTKQTSKRRRRSRAFTASRAGPPPQTGRRVWDPWRPCECPASVVARRPQPRARLPSRTGRPRGAADRPQGHGRDRRRQGRPEHSEQEGAGRRHQQDSQWVQPQGPAEGHRLQQVLEGVVGQQGDRQHGQGDTQALGAQGHQHREGTGEERPEERDVAGHEGHDGDRPGQRDPSSSAPSPTTAPFISRTMVSPRHSPGTSGRYRPRSGRPPGPGAPATRPAGGRSRR